MMPSTKSYELHIRQLVKNLKTSCKQFVIFLVVNFIIIVLFTLLFFYIEHCYDPITPPDSLQPYLDVCRYIHSNTTYSQNDTQLLALCKQAFNHTQIVIECTLDKKNFFKYFDYYGTIAYTIGMLAWIPKIFSLFSIDKIC